MIVKLAAGVKKIRFDNTAYQNKPLESPSVTSDMSADVVSIKKEISSNGIQWLLLHEVNESSLTRLNKESILRQNADDRST